MLRGLLAALCVIVTAASAAAQIRLKDLVEFDGVRGNDLIGYGLVVGLDGTGDGIRNAPFTEDIMTNILERLGVNITGEQFRPRNVAAVLVTAALPPFARTGSRVDVTVSAIGDASSLFGGTLVMTPLNGADGQIYAVAQGAVIAGGVAARGDAAQVVEGVPTSGSIPGGARVEREVEFALASLSRVRLALRQADFTTAVRIEQAINRHFGRAVAAMQDAGTVVLDIAATRAPSAAHALSEVENLVVDPGTRARVVIDQRSGTIVMGEDVRISRVAVAQGGLTLRVEESPQAVQPNPFSPGQTVVVPRTNASIAQQQGVSLAEVQGGTTLAEVVAGLNALGVGPRDMIDILNTINAAGALHADLLVR
ncbi:MAG: flagellar basal body P-ring protein FlgI [Rhodobacter sp.]|uniref:flagellar basal body P-ring protein FlgI n=1 Tax=Pararhodobacter sp. TaxID=2127056 RepID=UPI001D9345EB|nr:flagellar basal body P-ring protein FlgI [Pararhodobacter sp.]MCB1345029.1 flagellar basal body P-ring protein FlgI [Paracoccaceae bacterium]MCC0072215.1 flagellar basal body P-ring protein FlgI [Rhodobacter sp.]HPD92784.1 flagellar basal body P-ring protein FlgI [Pararhodobacter sp.]